VSSVARITRIIVDGESVDVLLDVLLDAETTAAIRRAVRLAQAMRARDLDRVVAAELARNPEATLDQLCAVSRRRRSEVACARKRVREASNTARGISSPERAVPGPGYGTSVEEPSL
jgi:hypothetical protein